MGVFMSRHEEDVMVSNAAEGIERAKQGKYAYITESQIGEYEVNKDCDLIIVGEWLRTNHFAFAFPRGQYEGLRKRVNKALLELEDNGVMETLKRKWWRKDISSCKVIQGYHNSVFSINPLSYI